MSLSVQISPNQSVLRKLSRLSTEVAGRKILTALRAGAMIVEADAKRRAPVVTGTLRRSIHVEDDKLQAGSVTVGTDVEYARRVEYGFAGADSLGRVFHQIARPYLRPALHQNKARIAREVKSALWDLIQREAR